MEKTDVFQKGKEREKRFTNYLYAYIHSPLTDNSVGKVWGWDRSSAEGFNGGKNRGNL